MKIFGIDFGANSNDGLQITSEDREWVLTNFEWLLEVFGYPLNDQISVDKAHFPKTLESKDLDPEHIISDLFTQLNLNRKQVSLEYIEDIRDTTDLPYGFEVPPVDCLTEFDIDSGKIVIHLAKSMLKHPDWLMASLCYELTRAKLLVSNVEFDTGTDTNLFVYLAAAYFGYGAIIGRNLASKGLSSDSQWETKWSYVAEIPYPVMAFSLAVFAKLKGNQEPEWLASLPDEIKSEFDLSIDHLSLSHRTMFDSTKMDRGAKIAELLVLADRQYRSREFSEAIGTSQQILLLTDYDPQRADMFNNIGYNKLRLGEYSNSIPDFEEALKLDPDYAFAHDNLGYALIMTGELEKGKESLERALATENNENAYSYRNMALYHKFKGEPELADKNFQKALSAGTPVDLLRFHYGQFLLEQGEREKATAYLKEAVDNGDPEAKELLGGLD